MNPDASRALACASYLRKLGLTPLPSKSEDKVPDMPTYAQYYSGDKVPEFVYTNWKAINVQVVAGAKHAGPLKVVVVDMDGDEAPGAWARICEFHCYAPRSAWAVRTGSGGMHLWYRLPQGMTECQSGIIWGVYDTWGMDGKGDWLKHREIRLVADNSLIVCPPSIHVDTGIRYEFLPGCSPNDIALPEVAPKWLLDMPRLRKPRFAEPPPAPLRKPEKLSGVSYRRNEVLAAIHDKLQLMSEWGLVTDNKGKNQSGWVSCYVPWRESPGSSQPSGSFNVNDGIFMDMKDGETISFFDLAVILQPLMFRSWLDCRDYCGDRYIGRIRRN